MQETLKTPDKKTPGKRTPAALMIQGTGSDVGKSLVVAGLGRAFTRRRLAVRPFKPQNMSNNAAVTPDGGEIGRAQELQARACGVPTSVHMNPVLLKPQSDTGAQVVVQGKVQGTSQAKDYHTLKADLLPKVMESFHLIGKGADLILVEGAGSPAEVNLRDSDIANMGFAEAADLAVVLVADIDRGGAIASLVGTLELLSPEERTRIKGYIINKFRGDPSLFDSALEIIKEKTGLDCLGILPWFEKAGFLPAEDSMALEKKSGPGQGKETQDIHQDIHIAVPRLPRIANFDDLDPLEAEPNVHVNMVAPGTPLPMEADMILLPGSKSTVSDLAFLKETGWDIDIRAFVRRGGHVFGLCGGYQMLGQHITDPLGLEGSQKQAEGLGLLEIETVMGEEKTLRLATGTDGGEPRPKSGYEMHLGVTEGSATTRPVVLAGRDLGGASSPDGLISGCYLHGLFADDDVRKNFLEILRPSAEVICQPFNQRIEQTLDHLADHIEAHLDLDALLKISGQGV